MCEALEELIQEGEARGEMKERRKTAKALNQEGMSTEKIAQVLGEDEKTVRNWLAHE